MGSYQDNDGQLEIILKTTQSPQNATMNMSTCYEGLYCSKEEYANAMEDFIKPQPIHYIFIVLNLIVFVVGLGGNCLVCFAVWRNHHMRTVTNIFIVNLSIGDLSVILLCLPSTLSEDVRHTWYFGSVMCKIIKGLQIILRQRRSLRGRRLPFFADIPAHDDFLQKVPISVSVSVLTLSCIAIERWYAICRPLSFKSTASRARTAIICIWLISIVVSIPQVLVVDTRTPYPEVTVLFTTCLPRGWNASSERTYWIMLMIFLYLIPLVMMGVAYSMIATCLWKNTIPGSIESGHRDGHSGASGAAESQLQARRKAAKMLMAVVVMFALCYLPVFLHTILYQFGVLGGAHLYEFLRAFAMTSHLLCYSNSAINPIIYNFMSAKFRKEFESACACCLKPCLDRRDDQRRQAAAGDSTYNSYKYTNSGISQTEQISMTQMKTHA